MFGWLLFDRMLFFGPTFSHLICYFGYFFVNSMALFKIKTRSYMAYGTAKRIHFCTSLKV